jgi:hypothetical protein
MQTFVSNLRLFWQGALFSYVALFHWFQPINYMASKVLMPLAQMFFFVFLGTFATSADNASFYVIGNAIQITAVSGIFGVTMSVGVNGIPAHCPTSSVHRPTVLLCFSDAPSCMSLTGCWAWSSPSFGGSSSLGLTSPKPACLRWD